MLVFFSVFHVPAAHISCFFKRDTNSNNCIAFHFISPDTEPFSFTNICKVYIHVYIVTNIFVLHTLHSICMRIIKISNINMSFLMSINMFCFSHFHFTSIQKKILISLLIFHFLSQFSSPFDFSLYF